jgi:hypothetical protein
VVVVVEQPRPLELPEQVVEQQVAVIALLSTGVLLWQILEVVAAVLGMAGHPEPEVWVGLDY